MIRIVQFSASWCGPCKRVSPVVAKIAEDNGIELVKVDIDEEPHLAELHEILSVPTIFKQVDGQTVAQVIGAHPEKKLREALGL